MRDPRFLARHGIKVNVPLAGHTRIRSGGRADFFVTAGTAQELASVLDGARDNALKTAVIGSGSRTVFADHGWRGLVVKNEIRYCDIDTGRGQVTAGSALPLADLINRLAEEGCGGFEPLVAYPGSVGGAIRANLRFGSTAIGRHVRSVTLYSGGRVIEVKAADLGFRPNESRLLRTGEIILGATLAIVEKDPNQIRRRLLEATRDRLRNDPAGTAAVRIFWDTPDEETATELLSRAGLAGEQIGQAMISKKNPNVIINLGEARSASVYELAQRMKHAVTMKFGAKLRDAVVWMGEW